jgi:hypothetical protein
MKLKVTNQIAIEKGIQLDNNDIKLVGCECFCHCDKAKVISGFIEENNCCNKKNSFKKVFGFNTKFYYKIEKVDAAHVVSYEVGIGYLEKNDKDVILKRHQPLFFSSDKGMAPCASFSGCLKFHCECDHTFLIVSNYFPDNYLQILADPHCVIASIDKHFPSPVHIEKNSVIGRLGDNIQSIDIPSLLNQTIKYDENTNTVQFFNGQRWIKLVEKIDENST